MAKNYGIRPGEPIADFSYYKALPGKQEDFHKSKAMNKLLLHEANIIQTDEEKFSEEDVGGIEFEEVPPPPKPPTIEINPKDKK